MDRHFLMSRVLRTAWLILNFQFINILINFPKVML